MALLISECDAKPSTRILALSRIGHSSWALAHDPTMGVLRNPQVFLRGGSIGVPLNPLWLPRGWRSLASRGWGRAGFRDRNHAYGYGVESDWEDRVGNRVAVVAYGVERVLGSGPGSSGKILRVIQQVPPPA